MKNFSKEMRVLVIGEYCRDFFQYGKVRLNPEAPSLVFVNKFQTSNDGMAGNTAANIKSLAPNVTVHKFFPHKTIHKIRYVEEESGNTVFRQDINDKVDLIKWEESPVEIGCCDAVVISSYNKGFLTPEIVQQIAGECKKKNIPLFVDCKWVLGEWSRDIFCVKINKKEYEYNRLHNPRCHYDCQNLVVTLGNDGAVLINGSDEAYFSSTEKIEVCNVSGAGDSFLAGLCVSYLETKNLFKSIPFANKVAAVAVSKRDVVAVKREDVR